MNKTTILLTLVLFLSGPASSVADILDTLCGSTADIVFTPAHVGVDALVVACPMGDTPTWFEQGWFLDVTIVSELQGPIANIPANDIWVADCDNGDAVILCAPKGGVMADGPTDADGHTTLAQARLAASLCGIGTGQVQDGMRLIVQGNVILDVSCSIDLCLPIHVRSVDLTGDQSVTPADLSTFAQGFPPNPFETCTDYTNDGLNTLADLSTFAWHLNHVAQ